MMHTRAVPVQWFHYELRRVGKSGLALPALTALPFSIMAVLLHFLGAGEWQVERMLAAYLELGLPLATGMVISHVISDDPAVDLQLALRTSYRITVLRRLSITVGWSSLMAILWTLMLWITGLLWVEFPEPLLLGQLVWMVPLLWFTGFGALLALVFKSHMVSVSVLIGVWAFEFVFPFLFMDRSWLRPLYLFATVRTPGVEFWLANRIVLAAVALGFLLAVVLMLRNSESLAAGGEG